MIATLAGLGAAVAFGLGMFAGTAAARQVGSAACTAWMMLVGLLVVVPVLLVDGRPFPDLEAFCLMLYVGAATLVGLLIVYSALCGGPVSVVIPIVSAEGAVAAAVASIAGQVPGPLKLLGMLVVVVSVITLVALCVDRDKGPRSPGGRSAAMAVVSCVLMGTMLFAQGRLGGQVSLAWSALPSRAATVAFLTLPLAAKGGLRISLANLKPVAVAGLADVVGMALFVLGSRHDVAVTSVLTSQYSVVSVILGAWVLGERLRFSQLCSVAALICGVSMVTRASV